MNHFAPSLAWIDDQLKPMIRRVVEWANINSGTHNLPGLARMATEVRRAFEVLGAEVEEIALETIESVDASGIVTKSSLANALRFRKRSNAGFRVFLAIHMDTVYGPDHPFQTTTMLDGDTLRGPGVIDAKGGLAVMLTALEALERSEFATGIGWEVLINPDEEIGSIGSAPLLVQGARRNHVGLVFEPALPDGAMVDRRRGVGNFTIVVHGRSAHAGRDFDRGRNAVVAAARMAVDLHALNSSLSGIAINVGRLEGGGALNVVPDLAICRVNVRTSVPEDEDRVQAELLRIVEHASGEEGISAELHGGFTSPPKIPDGPTHKLKDLIAACGNDLTIPINWRASGGACDGNKLAAAGLPTLDTLGPRGGDLHSPTEHLFLDSLTERAQLTALLLMKLATGSGIEFCGGNAHV